MCTRCSWRRKTVRCPLVASRCCVSRQFCCATHRRRVSPRACGAAGRKSENFSFWRHRSVRGLPLPIAVLVATLSVVRPYQLRIGCEVLRCAECFSRFLLVVAGGPYRRRGCRMVRNNACARTQTATRMHQSTRECAVDATFCGAVLSSPIGPAGFSVGVFAPAATHVLLTAEFLVQ